MISILLSVSAGLLTAAVASAWAVVVAAGMNEPSEPRRTPSADIRTW